MNKKRIHMKNKRITIIIPHYNSWEKLERAIASVPVRPDIQLIVVDDKSGDDTEKLPYLREKYGHVEFYSNDSGKKGAGQARNIGLEHAQGTWLCFMDADDYFLESFAEFTVLGLEEAYDIIYCTPTSVIDGTDRISHRHERYAGLVADFLQDPNEKTELVLRSKSVVPWSKFVKRELVTDHHISFEPVMYSNDVMFSVQTGFYAKKIKACPEILYCVTDGEGSLTKMVSKKSKRIRSRVYLRRCRFFRTHLSAKQMKMLGYHWFSEALIALNCLGIQTVVLSKCLKAVSLLWRRGWRMACRVWNCFRRKGTTS